MKNIIFLAILTLTLGALSSCTKSERLKEDFSIFSLNPFIKNNILATAD